MKLANKKSILALMICFLIKVFHTTATEEAIPLVETVSSNFVFSEVRLNTIGHAFFSLWTSMRIDATNGLIYEYYYDYLVLWLFCITFELRHTYVVSSQSEVAYFTLDWFGYPCIHGVLRPWFCGTGSLNGFKEKKTLRTLHYVRTLNNTQLTIQFLLLIVWSGETFFEYLSNLHSSKWWHC